MIYILQLSIASTPVSRYQISRAFGLGIAKSNYNRADCGFAVRPRYCQRHNDNGRVPPPFTILLVLRFLRELMMQLGKFPVISSHLLVSREEPVTVGHKSGYATFTRGHDAIGP